jgi:NAD-dependent dihydropyrimidine dehydrogenase PreA subunit
LCDYCVQHGHGQKWYLSARNYARELAKSEKVREFSKAFFGRVVKPGEGTGVPSGEPTEEERRKQDSRYHEFLHHQVVSTEEVLAILKLAGEQTEESDQAVVLLPCICRYRAYGSDANLSCYGLAFTPEYTRRFPQFSGGGHKYVSTEEAQDALERLIETGPIVHAMSALGVPYLGMLCNCEMPVCRPYIIRQHYGIASPFYKAHHRAHVDKQKCSGCGSCQDACPFDVAELDSEVNLARIDANACFGCGLCQRYCPENAISLVPVGDDAQF